MRARSLRGNRESSGLATLWLGGPHREEYRSTPVTHGPEQSDIAIVPKKPANKVPRRAAEWVEGKAVTKGNRRPRHTYRTQSRARVSQALPRVRPASRWDTSVIPCRLPSLPKVGAGWGSASRPDLCRGCRVTGIPTAIDHFSIQDQPTLYGIVSWLQRVLALAVPIVPWALSVEPATGFCYDVLSDRDVV